MVGRPIIIVASTRYITTPASKFIDHILSPLLPTIPSYVRDSTTFINDLRNVSVHKECYFVAADAQPLYTNIPIKDCLIAIDLFCRQNKVPFTALITELSRLVLSNNYFEADGSLYHQKWGLAMGTPMAVSAATIYMAKLEEPTLATPGLSFYRRFVDDIFLVWEGTYIDLQIFLMKLNSLAPTINLIWNISTKEVVFLDMTIVKEMPVTSNNLLTRPFQKPLNRYLYIPFRH